MSDETQPVITLLGDERENFYRLGLRDRAGFSPTYRSLQHNLGNLHPFLHKLLHTAIEQAAQVVIKRHSQLRHNLAAYGEGLNVGLENIYGTFLLPEILSGIGRFMPSFMGKLLGCSSLFYQEPQGRGITHFRLLDFPLADSFTQHAQGVLMRFPRQRVFFFTTQGMPYPGLTAMNESGITLALHQKLSRFFRYTGTPIFEVAKLIMAEARDRQDIEDIIKANPTMTSWGIYSCVGDELLEIDLLGDKHWIKAHSLAEGKTRYFCNECPDHPAYKRSIAPGFEHYNQMRRQTIEEHLAKKSQAAPLTREGILKALGTPLVHKRSSSARWRQSPLSPHTIDSCALNPRRQWALRVRGKAPRVFAQGYETYRQCFTRPKVKTHCKQPDPRLHHYNQGLRYLGQVTIAFQEKNIHHLFHFLQMAEEHFRGWPERTMVTFYNTVFHYILLKTARDEESLLAEFEQLLGRLPSYLNEQCQLFILRLHMLLGRPIPQVVFRHQALERIWQREAKLRPTILRAQRFLYVPRPDISDVIYPFSH